MRLIFLGPPGAGKGTQADRIAAHFNVPHIATGDMMRQAAARGTDFGLKAQEYMDRGELVPDDITNKAAKDRISEPDAEKGFILDGYPRTLEQAFFLDDALEEIGARLDRVIYFRIMGAAIVARVAGRRVCPVCKTNYHEVTHPPKVEGICDLEDAELVQREDDSPDTVLRRLEVYGEQTKPVAEVYSSRGLLVDVDAMGTSDEVFGRLLALIEK